jgi:serine/threonine protein kinase
MAIGSATGAPTQPLAEAGAVAGEPSPIFASDDVVAERYRITRFVARGGMGEVYDAHDLELGARVALKTIRPDIAADPKVLERFRREIFLARQVTHPNVCRIFDMGFHGGGGERIAFLTMEYLAGETLSDRIARGRLTETEAWPLVEQLAAGLAAAHREGVVHRDFKSANVMLVPRGAETRAVITDFGLARGTPGERLGDATTEQRGLVGSPVYMAPEQVAGLEVTAAADVYALGVVLFEMVTGTWPFVDHTPVLTALKRLQEPAPSARSRVPSLDARWDAAIARCLMRDPRERFASIDEVARALKAVMAPAPQPRTVARPPTARRGRAIIGGAAVAAIATAIIVFGWMASRHGDPPKDEPARSAAPSSPTPSPAAVSPPSAPAPAMVVDAGVSAPSSHPAATDAGATQQAVPPRRPPPHRPPSAPDPTLDHFITTYPK